MGGGRGVLLHGPLASALRGTGRAVGKRPPPRHHGARAEVISPLGSKRGLAHTVPVQCGGRSVVEAHEAGPSAGQAFVSPVVDARVHTAGSGSSGSEEWISFQPKVL